MTSCPFLRAVDERDFDEAIRVALAGDDPADVGAIPVLVAMAERHLAGEQIEAVVAS